MSAEQFVEAVREILKSYDESETMPAWDALEEIRGNLQQYENP